MIRVGPSLWIPQTHGVSAPKPFQYSDLWATGDLIRALDLSDPTALYQGLDGLTMASTPTNGRFGIAIGAEHSPKGSFAAYFASRANIVVNGGFSTPAVWNVNEHSSMVFSDGVLNVDTYDGVGSLTAAAYQILTNELTAGEVYMSGATMLNYTQGGAQLALSDNIDDYGDLRQSNAAFAQLQTFVGPNPQARLDAAPGGFAGAWDNVWVKHLPNFNVWGTQSLATRPQLRQLNGKSYGLFDGNSVALATPFDGYGPSDCSVFTMVRIGETKGVIHTSIDAAHTLTSGSFLLAFEQGSSSEIAPTGIGGTVWVDGVQITNTRNALYVALSDYEYHLVETRNPNLSYQNAATQFNGIGIGGYDLGDATYGLENSEVQAVIIMRTGAALTANRTNITNLMNSRKPS